MATRNIFIKTYGCQMNVYDSDKIVDILRPHGFQLCPYPENADIILLNTCHIREKATDKVFSQLGRYKKFKDAHALEGRQVILGVAGCVAQAEGAEIVRRAPYVDIVLGPQTYHRLPEMVERARRNFEQNKGKNQDEYIPPLHIIDTDFPTESKFDAIPLPKEVSSASAFVTIQEGCDKFCTFCCVPYTRGAEYSRPVQALIDETKALIDQGVKEITLLGQNVSGYHGAAPKDGTGEWSIASLMLELANIEGLERLRYMTSHPRDIEDDLIQVHGACEKIMPFLHLPVQSGSNQILKAMNRQHTRERYFEIIDALRVARPDLALSSDFIVGYPGETDQDFEETLDLIRRVNFSQAYSFKYSPRPGTPASAHDLQIPEDVKDQRLKGIQALLMQQQIDFNNSMIGKTMPILLERAGKRPGQLIGRSPYMQSTHVTLGQDMLGKICHVKIVSATLNSLGGTVEMTQNAE